MDSASRQPAAGPAKAENPIVAVGRRVKSALSSQQEPSVQIQRSPRSLPQKSLTEKLHLSHRGSDNGPERGQLDATDSDDVPPPVPPKDNANSSSKSFWSRFSKGDSVVDEKNAKQGNYDRETVDLLDVMGSLHAIVAGSLC